MKKNSTIQIQIFPYDEYKEYRLSTAGFLKCSLCNHSIYDIGQLTLPSRYYIYIIKQQSAALPGFSVEIKM